MKVKAERAERGKNAHPIEIIVAVVPITRLAPGGGRQDAFPLIEADRAGGNSGPLGQFRNLHARRLDLEPGSMATEARRLRRSRQHLPLLSPTPRTTYSPAIGGPSSRLFRLLLNGDRARHAGGAMPFDRAVERIPPGVTGSEVDGPHGTGAECDVQRWTIVL